LIWLDGHCSGTSKPLSVKVIMVVMVIIVVMVIMVIRILWIFYKIHQNLCYEIYVVKFTS
jgi:hypothetical protein